MNLVENYPTTYSNKVESINANTLTGETQDLLVSLSTPLNLIMVKGILCGNYDEGKFKNLAKRIKSHFNNTNILNVYIKIDAYDLEGIAHLFSLVQALNSATKDGNYISVYWNTQNDSAIQIVASEFHKLLDCDFHICDI